MEAQGMTSLFPLADIAVMGPVAILKALPRLTNRVYRTVSAGVAAKPDIVVIIDSPEFTHRVARRLRRKLRGVPIIDYVCPSVWAWRPGRARKMAKYIDHVLALLPFEPEALERLSGPPATFVGHPLAERQQWIQSIDVEAWAGRWKLDRNRVPLVVLPGSRRSEIEALMPIFGETITLLQRTGRRCELLMPCVPHLRERIEELSADWPMPRHYIEGEEAKFAAFRMARAAIAASGTVTLELGMAGTPMVVAYLVDGIAARLRFLIKVDSVVLANLVLGRNDFPELLQEDCNSEQLSNAVANLLDDTPERAQQLRALEEIAAKMKLTADSPSKRAADVVMKYASEETDTKIAKR
jgi:lipid-A-disaccharide synthase